MQREDQPVMTTELERIAAKARCEPKLRFTSLAHHVTRDRVWGNLCRIPRKSAPGTDGQTVAEAKETFEDWIEPMLGSVHRKGYRAPRHQAGLYPQARQTGDAPSGRALHQRPGAPAQLDSGAGGHL